MSAKLAEIETAKAELEQKRKQLVELEAQKTKTRNTITEKSVILSEQVQAI